LLVAQLARLLLMQRMREAHRPRDFCLRAGGRWLGLAGAEQGRRGYEKYS
jgi:hypothetical protein